MNDGQAPSLAFRHYPIFSSSAFSPLQPCLPLRLQKMRRRGYMIGPHRLGTDQSSSPLITFIQPTPTPTTRWE